MAFEQNLHTFTRPANADLSAAQYKLVKLANSSGVARAALVAAATDDAVGVLQNAPDAAGREATIAFGGVSKVMAGAAITAGASLTADASGRVVATSQATDVIVGKALESAGAAGDIIPVLLTLQGIK